MLQHTQRTIAPMLAVEILWISTGNTEYQQISSGMGRGNALQTGSQLRPVHDKHRDQILKKVIKSQEKNGYADTLAQLTALRQLCVADAARLSDAGVARLSALTRLTSLQLLHCMRVSSVGVNAVSVAAPELLELHLLGASTTVQQSLLGLVVKAYESTRMCCFL